VTSPRQTRLRRSNGKWEQARHDKRTVHVADLLRGETVISRTLPVSCHGDVTGLSSWTSRGKSKLWL